MSKYNLCYKRYGKTIPIELNKLECLKDKKTTDIKIIDIFTMQFKDKESLLNYLKEQKLIDKYINDVFITVDKKDKETGLKIDKKIFNGDILIFSDYNTSYNASTVINNVLNNRHNHKFIIRLCDNYLEKYQNAYDRITGSSFILSTLKTIKTLATKIEEENYEMNVVEMQAYYQCLNDFVTMEFYKIDKEHLKNTGKIKKKIDKYGRLQMSYRNIHDYITLLLSFKKNKKQTREEIVEEKVEHEEFLTEEDIKRSNREIMTTYQSKGFPEEDGNDWIVPASYEEIEDSLYESGMKLCLKPGDAGDLK